MIAAYIPERRESNPIRQGSRPLEYPSGDTHRPLPALAARIGQLYFHLLQVKERKVCTFPRGATPLHHPSALVSMTNRGLRRCCSLSCSRNCCSPPLQRWATANSTRASDARHTAGCRRAGNSSLPRAYRRARWFGTQFPSHLYRARGLRLPFRARALKCLRS